MEENLSQVNKTNESSTIEKLREEIARLTKDFRKLLKSSNTLTILLKFHQHLHDKYGLGLEKGASSSKSESVSNKCDLCGKFQVQMHP